VHRNDQAARRLRARSSSPATPRPAGYARASARAVLRCLPHPRRAAPPARLPRSGQQQPPRPQACPRDAAGPAGVRGPYPAAQNRRGDGGGDCRRSAALTAFAHGGDNFVGSQAQIDAGNIER
jgi:hypothetical protein